MQGAGGGQSPQVEGDAIGGHAGGERSDIVAPEHLGAAERRDLQGLPGGHRGRAVADSGEQHRLACLAEQVASIVRGRAVDAEADGHALAAHPRHRGDAGGEPHVRARAMRHPGAGAGKQPDPVLVELDAVGVPDVRPDPAEIGGVLGRRLPESFAAIRDVVLVLGEMGVEADAVGPGEGGGIPHQAFADREGRARRHHDPAHRVARGVVPGLDQPAGVGEDRGLVLDQGVGRQAAGTLAEAHRPAGGVEAQADLIRRFDAVVEAAAVGIEVEVVARRGAARQHQFGHRDLRRHPHHLGREPGPDRVERLQPAEQVGVLRRRHGAGERLEHVVVGVDEAGHQDVAGQVDHRVGALGQRLRAADRDDPVVLDQHEPVGDLAPVGVHGDDARGVAQEKRGHAGLRRGGRPCSGPAAARSSRA